MFLRKLQLPFTFSGYNIDVTGSLVKVRWYSPWVSGSVTGSIHCFAYSRADRGPADSKTNK